jgi:pyruvate dehydrogenase E2 component (dihydrolipoamide acetyltransferase)
MVQSDTMATQQVSLPQLGESVSSGTIVAWLVEPGDPVEVDDPIAEISTDKVDTEIPSPIAGTVVRRLVEVDAEVEVGEPILEIRTSGEGGAPADQGGPGPTDPPSTVPGAGTDDTETGSAQAAGTRPAPGDRLSPKVRRLLGEHGLEPADVEGTGADGRITPDDVLRAAAARTSDGPTTSGSAAASWRGLRLSPLVKRLLRDHDLDPRSLRGTGSQGRVTPHDVRAAAQLTAARRTAATASVEEALAPGASEDGRSRVEPLSRTRKVIAQRMLTSLQTTAQLTAAVEADVTRIMHARARFRDAATARYGFAPSPVAFIAKATCRALGRHPAINASIDTAAGTVTYHRPVHLGIAVDTPNGLMVPVVHDAHDLNVMALQERINDLAARTRDRKLSPDDVRGGTFTITNTGSGGVLFDTPILNPPEAAILATPRIEKRPAVVTDNDGTDSIAIRQRTYLCLSYDHRLIDGADAARFLTDLTAQLDQTDWEQELAELGG